MLKKMATDFELIFMAIPEPIVLIDINGEIVKINSAFSRLFGFDPEELEGKKLPIIYPKSEHFQDQMRYRFQMMGNDVVKPLMVQYKSKSGQIFSAETVTTQIHDARGKLTGYLDTIHINPYTITNEEKYRQLLELAPVGIIFLGQEGCIEFVNLEIERLFGYQQSELIGKTIEILIPTRFHQKHVQHRANFVVKPYHRPMGVGLDLAGLHKDGREFPVEVSLKTVRFGDKSVVLCFVVDVSIQRQMESELRKSEELLKATISSMDDLVFILDKNGIFMAYDERLSHHQYFPGRSIWGKNYQEVLPSHAVVKIENAIKKVMGTGMVQQFDYCLEINDKDIWFDAKVSARTNNQGEFDGVTIISRDITDRKIIEAKLAQNMVELEAQNAELDAFAHTVAHELKTPVALILGYGEILQDHPDLTTNSEMLEALNQTISTGNRINNIIGELLLLAGLRKSNVQIEPINMFAVVEEAQRRLSFMIRKYKAEIKLPYTWPNAMGYAPWIEEVWTNYLSNAMKYGGSPPRIELGGTLRADGMARFWVKDNGPGISEEDQDKIFTPFTQLKQIRIEGHGLGLSIVKRIVEKCQGKVGVESEVGVGSTFWFTLPMVRDDE